jgi:hypothetical protein
LQVNEETDMNQKTPISILFVSLLGLSTLGLSTAASANEYTDVIDSFDVEAGDMFDLNFSVGYLMEHRAGTVTRETTQERADEWEFYGYRDMFKYKQTRHIFDMNLDIGLFRDVSLRVGLPLILSDTRSLTALSGWVNDNMPWETDGNASLFGDFGTDKTFNSQKRSGVDYMSVGLWINPLDQSREISFPTWTLFAEGRFAIGKVMRAACAKDEAGCFNSQDSGVSRGVHEIRFGTRLSRRIGIFDPHFGVDAKVGFPKGGTDTTDFYASNSKSGQINTLPPITGTMDVGMEITPWEMPAKNRKLVISAGLGASFFSEGREYTPLYDALGTSGYDGFQTGTGQYVDFNGNGTCDFEEGHSCTAEWSEEAKGAQKWTGMTDVENYASIFGQLFVLVQPAKYVKFRIGGKWAHETQHFITKTDMCSIDLMDVIGGATEQCKEYNMGYRPELDTPGLRFRAESTFVGTFFADVTAMF